LRRFGRRPQFLLTAEGAENAERKRKQRLSPRRTQRKDTDKNNGLFFVAVSPNRLFSVFSVVSFLFFAVVFVFSLRVLCGLCGKKS